METEGSLAFLQEWDAGIYPEPVESYQRPPTLFLF
jgi:hypothetical protein